MTAAARTARTGSAARRSRGQRGFTLIELTVALMAGLIVGMAVVGLSRDSTRTFHEEMRASAAEANLRSAADRLRSDLSRAGYMSTGDILNDPMIVKKPGTLNPAPPGFLGLGQLASVQLTTATSVTNGLTLSLKNGVDPAALEIGGNMTTTDQYAASLQPGMPGGCQRILLNPQTPAMFRVLNSTVPQTELRNIFQPSPAGVLAQFIVRVLDKTGHSQFLATCPSAAPTGILGAAPNWQPYVDVDANTPVLTAQQTSGVSSITGFASGDIWVNPVQIVRWEIVTATSEQPQYTASPMGVQPLAPTVADPTKYDLVRSYVDAKTGKPIPQTQEVIAENAVDLDFAFSAEAGTPLQPNTVTFAFGDPNNLAYARALAQQPNPAVTGPGLVRSVRARIVTRAAQPDRTLNVAVPAPAGPFMYRYCIVAAGCNPINAAGVLQYARARTLTVEVSLANQARSFFP